MSYRTSSVVLSYTLLLLLLNIVVDKNARPRAIQKSTVGPLDEWFSRDGPRNNNCNAKRIRSASEKNNGTYAFNQLRRIAYVILCGQLDDTHRRPPCRPRIYCDFCYHLSVGTYMLQVIAYRGHNDTRFKLTLITLDFPVAS